ncbi:MAG: TetR/AcrR family transcriptional regulator, partial [Steroidobacteraceae bacterium]
MPVAINVESVNAAQKLLLMAVLPGTFDIQYSFEIRCFNDCLIVLQRSFNIKPAAAGGGRPCHGAGDQGHHDARASANACAWLESHFATNKKMSRPKRTTKDKLMDAAEKLFARRGFHGASLRDITAAAGVDLALVNYHFGSKYGLLGAVMERRGGILNEERLQRLAQ